MVFNHFFFVGLTYLVIITMAFVWFMMLLSSSDRQFPCQSGKCFYQEETSTPTAPDQMARQDPLIEESDCSL